MSDASTGVHVIILMVVAGLVLTFVKWAFLPGRRLPRNRVRDLRLRLRLRLHPGKGHATTAELWWPAAAGLPCTCRAHAVLCGSLTPPRAAEVMRLSACSTSIVIV